MARQFGRYLCLLLAVSLATVAAAPRGSTILERWAMPIDSRNNSSDWLSVRAGVVYTIRNAHVVAIELATGRLRWTSSETVESRPAIGGGTIYAPIARGIVALDANTGKELGRRAFDETPSLITTDFAAVAIIPSAGKSRLIGYRDSLTPRWQRQFARSWGRPDDVGHNTILIWDQSGSAVIALDAATGNAMATTDGVEEYVGRDRSQLWFSVANGGLKDLDLDTNQSFAIHNGIVRGAVRVEGRTAVAVIDGRLTQLSLPDGHETTLRVDGRWVGGPANRTIFVSRDDGTYALPLDGGKATRIVTNTSDARFLTSTGKSAYFATNDGSIIAANLDNLSIVRRLATACRFVEGIRIIDGTALVHCDDSRSASQLYAFAIARN